MLKLALLSALIIALTPTSLTWADIVVRRTGTGFSSQVADSLVRALQASPGGSDVHVVDLTGDWNTDAARVARGSEGQTTVYAIGPDATVAAAQARRPNLIALAVPNPARLRTQATYVSMYPRLEKIFDFLGKGLKARNVGFLYTPAQNAEVAAVFTEAAKAKGLTLVPIAVGSEGELARRLRDALPAVDALLLPVDPILFDRQAMQTIVEESTKLKKPTLGFLDALPGLGVTACMVTPAAAAASAAIDAAHGKVAAPGGRIELDTSLLVVSRKSALAMGLTPEAIGAQKIE